MRVSSTIVGVGLGGTALVARAVTRCSDRGGVAINDATNDGATHGPARAARRARLRRSLAFAAWPLLPDAQQCAQRMFQKRMGSGDEHGTRILRGRGGNGWEASLACSRG